MKRLVVESVVWVLGRIWLPFRAKAGLKKMLNVYDVENCRDAEGKLTRESVEQWVLKNSGDFSVVDDFAASLEDPVTGETVEIDWEKGEESTVAYREGSGE